MKKSKKFLSMLLAVSMIMAMSVSAFAAEYPDYIPMNPPKTITWEQLQDATTSPTREGNLNPAKVWLNYTAHMGDNGTGICYFTADTRNFYFAMRLTTGYTGRDYLLQLWQRNPDGTSTKVGDYHQYNFGEGPAWTNELEIGTDYFVKVSSQSIPTTGAQCEYIWSTSSNVSFND